MKVLNARWIKYLSYEKDERGNALLREDTPEEIKKEYEEHKKMKQRKKEEYMKRWEQ